jgi:hypothetical protein
MLDELFDRSYAAGRAELNNGIARVLHRLTSTIGASLKALHRVEWNAPWKRQHYRA